MEPSWMPGPTDEARALQLKQCALLDAMHAASNDFFLEHGDIDSEASRADPACLEAKNRYEASVAALKALLGPDAHCNSVDADLWSFYSDCYKSENGFRPRAHVTCTEATAYLDKVAR